MATNNTAHLVAGAPVGQDWDALRSPGGVVNLRDAAALAGPAARLVRRGVLYRSDAPVAGDPSPQGLTTWPPATVIDLRSPGERGSEAHPWVGPGTAIEELPLATLLGPESQARLRSAAISLPELYDALLDSAAAWVPELMELVAARPGPLLVHCAAGKDRTGVAVAVLLAVAGVPPVAIESDYLATNAVLPALAERMHRDHPGRPAVPAQLLGAPREAITTVLHRIGPDAAGWCHTQGADRAHLARWQHRIWPDSP